MHKRNLKVNFLFISLYKVIIAPPPLSVTPGYTVHHNARDKCTRGQLYDSCRTLHSPFCRHIGGVLRQCSPYQFPVTCIILLPILPPPLACWWKCGCRDKLLGPAMCLGYTDILTCSKRVACVGGMCSRSLPFLPHSHVWGCWCGRTRKPKCALVSQTIDFWSLRLLLKNRILLWHFRILFRCPSKFSFLSHWMEILYHNHESYRIWVRKGIGHNQVKLISIYNALSKSFPVPKATFSSGF